MSPWPTVLLSPQPDLIRLHTETLLAHVPLREGAVITALVIVIVVAVITEFKAIGAGVDVHAQLTVTTSSGHAVVQAGVRLALVAVVARLVALMKRVLKKEGTCVGLANGTLSADGKIIYKTENLKVGLFKS